ncbi:MAG: polyphenol oxidase family protein, partial [Gammaproteobacteria bacterium]|nr:polyphenol oxidase family protein [Gammaproteobacteria bacterium]
AAGIIPRAVAAFDAPPAELVAWLGPAIGPRAYVVGEDLRARFLALDAAHAAAFHRDAAGWHLDLAAIAATQLRATGVTSISQAARCVHDDAGHFFSYRRDGETGRMAALVWIEDRA